MKSIRIAIAGTALLALVACGSSEGGTAAPATTSSTSASSSTSSTTSSTSTSSSPTSTSTSTSDEPTSEATSDDAGIDPVAAELVTKLVAGFADTTSVQGAMYVEGGGMTADTPLATFGQLTSGGTLSAMQMTMTIPGSGDFEIIAVDGRLFLGGALAANYGNQYVEVSETTTDATLSQLYTTFSDALNSASVSQYLTFLQLATQTENVGTETVGGVEAEKYTMVLDLTRLDSADIDPSTRASMETLAQAGVTELPCTFWVDAEGHLIQVQQDVTVSGQSVQTTVGFTGYNVPLEIAAPDPSLVVVAP